MSELVLMTLKTVYVFNSIAFGLNNIVLFKQCPRASKVRFITVSGSFRNRNQLILYFKPWRLEDLGHEILFEQKL